MTNREIILRNIEFNNPPRIGLDFQHPDHEISWIRLRKLDHPDYRSFSEWGRYDELLRKVPDFPGEVKYDMYGNIHGRYNQQINDQKVIRGALEDGWHCLADYVMPAPDPEFDRNLKSIAQSCGNNFLLGVLPMQILGTLRMLRKFENTLMDIMVEEEMVNKILDHVVAMDEESIEIAGNHGFNGIYMGDDWGTQESLLINPAVWRRIFKPRYRKLIQCAHQHDMKFFLHSCGYIDDIIEDFIEIEMDVLQLDQAELLGVERLAKEFGGRISFWCPVDIQRVMKTGNRRLIEEEARKMTHCFKKYQGGFIAKDYPQWEAIQVKQEWAQWARDEFRRNADYL